MLYFVVNVFQDTLLLFHSHKLKKKNLRGSRRFCQRGSNSDKGFFLFLEGLYHKRRVIIGPQRNAIQMVDDGPTLNAGLVALLFFRGYGPVLIRNSIALWFSRMGVQTLYTPL